MTDSLFHQQKMSVLNIFFLFILIKRTDSASVKLTIFDSHVFSRSPKTCKKPSNLGKKTFVNPESLQKPFQNLIGFQTTVLSTQLLSKFSCRCQIVTFYVDIKNEPTLNLVLLVNVLVSVIENLKISAFHKPIYYSSDYPNSRIGEMSCLALSIETSVFYDAVAVA